MYANDYRTTAVSISIYLSPLRTSIPVNSCFLGIKNLNERYLSDFISKAIVIISTIICN